jgi:hypothetical protein
MGDTGQKCLITIDGVDFKIFEPKPFCSSWYSHKFRGPGIRYENGICIATGFIVSFNGPFKCGAWPDLKIFKSLLKTRLGCGEKVVADRGYKGDLRICHPDMGTTEQQIAMGQARARHETVNGRIKNWVSMSRVFRHSRDKHHLLFCSVIVIEQIKMMNGKPAFQVDTVVDPLFAWE